MTHRCPVFLGYFLIFPLRRLYQNPWKILGRFVKKGMTILEIGPGMGFFSLPLAKMTGRKGRVICVDVQEGMIARLKKRAGKAGLSSIIETRLCGEHSLRIGDLKDKIDFAIAFAVVHEVSNASVLFNEIYLSLRRGGRLFIAEPKGHSSQKNFDNILTIVKSIGFKISGYPAVRQSRAVLLEKI